MRSEGAEVSPSAPGGGGGGRSARSLMARVAFAWARVLVLLTIVLFASAGTWRYWQAWLYLGLQLGATAASSIYLLWKDPALLERRLAITEGEKVQKVVMLLVRLSGLASLVVAGLDHRFGWSSVPAAVIAAGGALFIAGNVLVLLVFRENTYTASVIRVEPGQTVTTTGPYRFVRHPMYAGALITSAGAPFILGSYWAAAFLPVALALFAARIVAEERTLREELPGYREYTTKTRHRLIPGVW